MSNAIRIQVNKPLPGYTAGQIVKVEACSAGIPLDMHWRRRLKDSEIDGCCEIVADESEKSEPKKRRTRTRERAEVEGSES